MEDGMEDGMEKATSADGTPIAYDTWGSGPVVVVVGGAFNDRRTWAALAEGLAGQGFTAVSYDRRGRGDSGDGGTPSVEREIEDLGAVIDAAGGGPVCAHGVSSGGALLLRGLATGLPVARASVLEVPYRVEGSPPAPERYLETLRDYVDAGDRAGLVEYFQTRVVGLPAEMLEPMKGTPVYASLLAMSPTLVHDGLALGGDDQSLPVDLLAGIGTPVLSVTSTGTTIPWLTAAAEQVAAALPAGRFTRLEGGFHEVPVDTLAPELARFYLDRG